MTRVTCASSPLELPMMKPSRHAQILLLFAAFSSPAFASAKLTPQQCNDYPFVRMTQPVTHKQLQNELVELESVGYSPDDDGDSDDYPAQLQAAEQRLQEKYQRDCTQSIAGVTTSASNHASAMQ
jgi:hypothetical protein